MDGNFLSSIFSIDRIGTIGYSSTSRCSSALQSSNGDRRASSKIASWRAAGWLVKVEAIHGLRESCAKQGKKDKGNRAAIDHLDNMFSGLVRCLINLWFLKDHQLATSNHYLAHITRYAVDLSVL